MLNKENTPKVSIIIPVFNVENYIEKCIKSIAQQKYKNFECIVVDDGSPDKSIEIVKSLVKNDSRFIIITKENGGLSSARNEGIENATGEYILFVDSDDYIDTDLLSTTVSSIVKYDADICMFGLRYVDENGATLDTVKNNSTSDYFEKDFLITENIVFNVACNKLYRRSVFNEIRFDENILSYEDAYIMPEVVYNKKICHVKKPLYNYVQRPLSLSKTISDTFIKDRTALIIKHHKFAQRIGKFDYNDPYIIKSYLKNYIYHGLMKICRYSESPDEHIEQFKENWDTKFFNLKNIKLMMKTEPKIGLLLTLFKTSPLAFKKFIKFWFRNYAA